MSSNCYGQFYDSMVKVRRLVSELRTEITFLSYSNICSLYGSYIKHNIQCINKENVSSAGSYGSFTGYCICEKLSEKTCLQESTGTVELFRSLQENTVMVDVKMNNITDYIFNHSVTQDGVEVKVKHTHNRPCRP